MRQRRKPEIDHCEGMGDNGGTKGGRLLHRPRQGHTPTPNNEPSNSPSGKARNNFVSQRRVKQSSNINARPHLRYVLPCFRIKSKRDAVLMLIGASVLLLSFTTIYTAHSMHNLSRHSPSSGMILPSSKEWGVGRESRRRRKRQQSATDSGTVLNNSTKISKHVRERKHEHVAPVKSQVYEAHLASFYTKLAEEGAASELSFNDQDSLGQDMSVYANIGCSVFNKLYHSKNNITNSEYSGNEDTIRRFWQSHHASILDASRLGDMSFAHKNWTSTLIKSLSPYTLVDSLSSSGTINLRDAERILGIIVRRILGLMQVKAGAEATLPPPLRIAIFGGPTVAGKGCHRGRGMSRASIQTNPTFCAFPYRLEEFLNLMLLPPSVSKRISNAPMNSQIVEVSNLGEEGTYSDYSEAIVRNRMYPPGQSPDIVIHAYDVDDYGGGISDIQQFYAAVHTSFTSHLKDDCRMEDRKPPPVILHALLENNQTNTGTTVTSILGEAVDDVEEGETSLPFLGDITGVNNKGGAFGMAGHAAASWVLAFDLAHVVLNHCTSNTKQLHSSSIGISKQTPIQNEYSFRCDNGIYPPCIFSILSGAKGNVAKPSHLLQSLTPFMVENTGWSPSSDMTAGFSRKTGIVATTPGATMTMLFRNITRPVRRFDVITLRSTSRIWRDGAAQFILVTGGDFSHGGEAADASIANSKETSFEISAELIADGEGDTHVTYHFGIDLEEGENAAESGSDLLLKIVLTKGDKFKILGLMLCE